MTIGAGILQARTWPGGCGGPCTNQGSNGAGWDWEGSASPPHPISVMIPEPSPLPKPWPWRIPNPPPGLFGELRRGGEEQPWEPLGVDNGARQGEVKAGEECSGGEGAPHIWWLNKDEGRGGMSDWRESHCEKWCTTLLHFFFLNIMMHNSPTFSRKKIHIA